MTDIEIILKALENQGKNEAIDLRKRSPRMNGTELIREEQKIPLFNPQKDYSSWERGNPVLDEEQVWILLQPYNAANYAKHPSSLRSIWGLVHTKDSLKAKPWVDALGTSGMYMKDECYLAEDGSVYKSLEDNLIYDAKAHPQGWKKVL